MRILLIEDDADLRTLLTEVLSEAGPSVVRAFSVDGLSRWEPEEPYDVAFTDLAAPRVYDEVGARTWVERVRRLARRVVVVTGAPSALVVGASGLGADLLVSKPFDLESILAAVGPTRS